MVSKDRHQSPIRWEPGTYTALRAASSITGNSVNGLANTAVTYYLQSDEFAAERAEAEERARLAIEKLGGG